MPTSRSNFAIAAYQGKIYCIGGEVLDEPGAYRMYRVVEVYDIVTDSWSVKNDAPFDGLGIQAQVIDGKIFVIKGQNLFMYNPITDEWTQKISIPRPDDISNDSVPFAIFSVVVDNKIMIYFKYLPEGSSSIPPNRLKGKIMIYDAKTDAWSEVTKFSEVISGIVWGTTGVYAPKKVYISGQSYNDYGTEDTFGTWIYDPVKNTWSAVKIDPTTLPITYRDQFGVAVVDDILYVIGGKDAWGYDVFSYNEQYVPNGYDSSISIIHIVAIFILTAGIVVTGLFFYFKKESSCKKIGDG
jgi:N-acetylneuraminic acid mutarotase